MLETTVDRKELSMSMESQASQHCTMEKAKGKDILQPIDELCWRGGGSDVQLTHKLRIIYSFAVA